MRCFSYFALMFAASTSQLSGQTASVTPSATVYALGGGQLTFTVTLTFPTNSTVSFTAKPSSAEWVHVSTGGAQVPTLVPSAGETTMPSDTQSSFGWAYYEDVPANTATFSFVLSCPSGLTGPQTITFSGDYRVNEVRTVFTIAPITLVAAHSGDTNGNSQIEGSELTRMLQLFNTRFVTPDGAIRTGAYRVQVGTIDGFAPDATRQVDAPITLSRYHSGDTNQNGQIEGSELVRIYQLFNTRFTTPDGKVRTGAYKFQAGTVDGFAPDLDRAPPE